MSRTLLIQAVMSCDIEQVKKLLLSPRGDFDTMALLRRRPLIWAKMFDVSDLASPTEAEMLAFYIELRALEPRCSWNSLSPVRRDRVLYDWPKLVVALRADYRARDEAFTTISNRGLSYSWLLDIIEDSFEPRHLFLYQRREGHDAIFKWRAGKILIQCLHGDEPHPSPCSTEERNWMYDVVGTKISPATKSRLFTWVMKQGSPWLYQQYRLSLDEGRLMLYERFYLFEARLELGSRWIGHDELRRCIADIGIDKTQTMALYRAYDYESFAWSLQVLIDLVADGCFLLPRTTKLHCFIDLVKDLPLDLQMMICHRAYPWGPQRGTKNYITAAQLDVGLKVWRWL